MRKFSPVICIFVSIAKGMVILTLEFVVVYDPVSLNTLYQSRKKDRNSAPLVKTQYLQISKIVDTSIKCQIVGQPLLW